MPLITIELEYPTGFDLPTIRVLVFEYEDSVSDSDGFAPGMDDDFLEPPPEATLSPPLPEQLPEPTFSPPQHELQSPPHPQQQSLPQIDDEPHTPPPVENLCSPLEACATELCDLTPASNMDVSQPTRTLCPREKRPLSDTAIRSTDGSDFEPRDIVSHHFDDKQVSN
jgi:hypothetical protein